MNTFDFDFSMEETVLGQIWTAIATNFLDVLDDGSIIGQGQGTSLEEAIANLQDNLLEFFPELF